MLHETGANEKQSFCKSTKKLELLKFQQNQLQVMVLKFMKSNFTLQKVVKWVQKVNATYEIDMTFEAQEVHKTKDSTQCLYKNYNRVFLLQY